MRTKSTCPFCDGDGCCFCDHEGTIYVGPNEYIKSEDALQSVGVKYLKDVDRETGGDVEVWPEMFVYYLDEKNVPDSYKAKLQSETEWLSIIPKHSALTISTR